MVKIGIIGGTGYTGVELMRLLGPRSDVSISVITSRELCGTPVDTLFPNLRGIIDLKFSEPDNPALDECDVVFFATPHSVAMQRVPKLLKAGVRLIDLSADFRLKDADLWQRWYGMSHECPELLAEAVYGLPE
ncbi:MAG: N-acetyl-gamma-glutamyl-phosphate reductase, partial [Gammaproteobacteria bacterium]|nr:N-acetyl-gamma-glutamyl-phosphate reductase [Gammaproteobacteria bacterium]